MSALGVIIRRQSGEGTGTTRGIGKKITEFYRRKTVYGIAWMEKRYYNDVVLSTSEFTRSTALQRK